MRGLLALLLILIASPVVAQSVIVSPEPETVSLTVYRAQNRGENPISKDWPQGYALITETRTVQIPAGDAVIRFEGVAEGMFPESAIVTGLPNGVREKNRDARLLSPQGLVDAYLKRAVTLTRTNRATGVMRTQEAFITAGPNGGVVLQTADGYEALHCTGLPERMSYGGAPTNLSSKPTLSVLTTSEKAVTAKLTLTYMSAGFDWEANYVAQVQPRDAEGKGKVDFFAWLTLANGGNQSFIDANTMAIAGEPNRVNRAPQARPTGGALTFTCWPSQRTHQVPYRLGYDPEVYPAPPPSPMMAAGYADASAEEVVVTARRRDEKSMSPVAVIVAEQENLGDLKLYRIPERVTVNAKGQKQVAMLVKPGATFHQYYTANVDDYSDDSEPMSIMMRGDNTTAKGLGLPMPGGQVAIFEDSKYGPLLAGETSMNGKAVGEEIEMRVGSSADVRMTVSRMSDKEDSQKWKVEINNARNRSVNVEVEIPYELRSKIKGVTKVDGVPTWKSRVAAHSDTSFTYELKLKK